PSACTERIAFRSRSRTALHPTCTPRSTRRSDPCRAHGSAPPESLHIRFAEHPLRPAFVGKGHDRPVQAPLVEDDLERALGKLLGACLAHAHPIEVGKEARIGIACDGDLRPLNPGEVLELLELPRR